MFEYCKQSYVKLKHFEPFPHMASLGIKSINILLIGTKNSGATSVLASLASIFKGSYDNCYRDFHKFMPGLTRHHFLFSNNILKKEKPSKNFGLNFWKVNCARWHQDKYLNKLEHVLNGRVLESSQFDSNFLSYAPNFERVMHSVIFVFDVNFVKNPEEEIRMKEAIDLIISKGIPVLPVLTKIDNIYKDGRAESILENWFDDYEIRKLLKDSHSIFTNFSSNHILPFVNITSNYINPNIYQEYVGFKLANLAIASANDYLKNKDLLEIYDQNNQLKGTIILEKTDNYLQNLRIEMTASDFSTFHFLDSEKNPIKEIEEGKIEIREIWKAKSSSQNIYQIYVEFRDSKDKKTLLEICQNKPSCSYKQVHVLNYEKITVGKFLADFKEYLIERKFYFNLKFLTKDLIVVEDNNALIKDFVFEQNKMKSIVISMKPMY